MVLMMPKTVSTFVTALAVVIATMTRINRATTDTVTIPPM